MMVEVYRLCSKLVIRLFDNIYKNSGLVSKGKSI